jgi:hypothetical protein
VCILYIYNKYICSIELIFCVTTKMVPHPSNPSDQWNNSDA